MDIIALIDTYVRGLLHAEEKFLCHLDALPELEQTVSRLSNQMAAGFSGLVLSNADRLIRESGIRKANYTVQRERLRTLISSVGDITFTHTLYKRSDGRTCCLLDDLIRLPDRERFTTVAEAKLLNEAEVHSYQYAAELIETNGETVTKATVMNKVHAIVDEIPEMEDATPEKKQCEYLYIEADEDHIHGQKDGRETGSFLGKLVYLFEGKEEVCEGKRKLVRPFYFGGLYAGTERNAQLWESVEDYIGKHYDQDTLKCVYISGDGAGWIRAARDHVCKGRLVADRYHLMKYINRVARWTEENEEETKKRFYKYIYTNKLLAAKKMLTRIKNRYKGSEHAVEECRTYLTENWECIQRAFHDRHVLGEQHILRADEFPPDGMEQNRGRPDVQAEVFYQKLWAGKSARLGQLPQGESDGGTACDRHRWNDRDGTAGEVYGRAERSIPLCRAPARDPVGNHDGTQDPCDPGADREYLTLQKPRVGCMIKETGLRSFPFKG